MVTTPFLLAATSLVGSFVVAVWAAGWRPALGVVAATVVSMTGLQLDAPTTALALVLLAVLIAIRFPWREPISLEIIVGEGDRLPHIRRVSAE